MRAGVLIRLALAALTGLPAAGAQELRFGRDGNVTWEGEVSGLEDVATIQPEFRPSLTPGVTEIGVVPDGRVELAHADHPQAILPVELDEGENRRQVEVQARIVLCASKEERGHSGQTKHHCMAIASVDRRRLR